MLVKAALTKATLWRTDQQGFPQGDRQHVESRRPRRRHGLAYWHDSDFGLSVCDPTGLKLSNPPYLSLSWVCLDFASLR